MEQATSTPKNGTASATPKKKTNKQKRKPKGSINFKLSLTDEQKEVKRNILQNDIIAIFGKAGSGKTLVGMQAALDAHFNREINNIHIGRPAVNAGEDLGALPGELEDKMKPWMEPIFHNMYELCGKQKIARMMEKGEIHISTIGHMRGKTFVDSYVVIDEAQNLTVEQMKMVITRLGRGSKLILCGDLAQVDLRGHSKSGLGFVLENCSDIEGFVTQELTENHRHPIIQKFLERFDLLDS